jgi:hypothetical protein
MKFPFNEPLCEQAWHQEAWQDQDSDMDEVFPDNVLKDEPFPRGGMKGECVHAAGYDEDGLIKIMDGCTLEVPSQHSARIGTWNGLASDGCAVPRCHNAKAECASACSQDWQPANNEGNEMSQDAIITSAEANNFTVGESSLGTVVPVRCQCLFE